MIDVDFSLFDDVVSQKKRLFCGIMTYVHFMVKCFSSDLNWKNFRFCFLDYFFLIVIKENDVVFDVLICSLLADLFIYIARKDGNFGACVQLRMDFFSINLHGNDEFR